MIWLYAIAFALFGYVCGSRTWERPIATSEPDHPPDAGKMAASELDPGEVEAFRQYMAGMSETDPSLLPYDRAVMALLSLPVAAQAACSVAELTRVVDVVAAALLAAEQRGRGAETWRGMETAPRDGTHILADLGPGTPPTTVHWFADDPALGGAGNAGWYISVQQNDGPAVNPVAWQHLPTAAAIRTGEQG